MGRRKELLEARRSGSGEARSLRALEVSHCPREACGYLRALPEARSRFACGVPATDDDGKCNGDDERGFGSDMAGDGEGQGVMEVWQESRKSKMW